MICYICEESDQPFLFPVKVLDSNFEYQKKYICLDCITGRTNTGYGGPGEE